MPKYHFIHLNAGEKCPEGYTERVTRRGVSCTKELSAEEAALAAAAKIPVRRPPADPAVDALEALMAGLGVGEQAVVEWGGEGPVAGAGGMNVNGMEGGARRRRHSRKGASRRKSHRKSHRRSAHRKGASRRTRRHA